MKRENKLIYYLECSDFYCKYSENSYLMRVELNSFGELQHYMINHKCHMCGSWLKQQINEFKLEEFKNGKI